MLTYPEFNSFLTGSITPKTQKSKKNINFVKKQNCNNENTVINSNKIIPYINSNKIEFMPQNYLNPHNNIGMQNYQHVVTSKNKNFNPTENL